MNFDYRKVAEAFEFVSAGSLSSHKALLDRETGEVHVQAAPDEGDGLSQDDAGERYVAVPTRTELYLGKPLVISFIRTHDPDSLSTVYKMFCYRNAFSRFKELLVSRNMLDQWREYEREETQRALREWCRRMGIALVG